MGEEMEVRAEELGEGVFYRIDTMDKIYRKGYEMRRKWGHGSGWCW